MAEKTILEQTAADQWKVLPSGLTVIVRPMPGYSGTHVIVRHPLWLHRPGLPAGRPGGASPGRRGPLFGAQDV